VEAIQTLHELIATADNDLLPRFYLGRLYYRLEMLDEALRQLSSIAERVAVSPTFHKLLARIHERRGNLQRAAQSYMAALEQAGLASTEYACTACGEGHAAWSDRCEQCGAWSSLELAFEEERLTAAELGVRERPVWTVVEDGDDEPFSA
jgi:tetratricopeptide (TPR) repeat protein